MSKSVVVVGAGALGSHLVQFLRSEDVTITVIDFDRVEQKNVQSQFHAKPHVGKLKVDALKQSMQMLYGIKIKTVSNKLVENNAENLLNADLIIDCLDNGVSRRIVQGLVRSRGTPCLHGALAADGSFGRVIWSQYFTIDEEGSGKATCEDGDHLPFIAVVASYLALSAQRFLRNGEQLNLSIYPSGAMRL